VVEIRGIPFCEGCAREQEAYFAIGELTDDMESLREEPLADLLALVRHRIEPSKVLADEPDAA
jgi:hypothetical protein